MIPLARNVVADARGTPAMRSDAARIVEEEGSALDSTTHMLVVEYRDAYAPNAASMRASVTDSLRRSDGRTVDRAFYQGVVAYRRATVGKVDEFLERGRRADLKALGTALRSDETRGIAALEQRTARR